MDVKDLNKSQLILLALLLSFVTSIATGITTVTLMDQAPKTITTPITRIVRQTVEKIVPVENTEKVLTEEEEKLLKDLENIKILSASVYQREEGKTDKLLGSGFLLGENKLVLSNLIPKPKEGEKYIIKSFFGEKKMSSLSFGEDFTIVGFSEIKESEKNDEKTESPLPTENTPPENGDVVGINLPE